jgi:hypothetical protein
MQNIEGGKTSSTGVYSFQENSGVELFISWDLRSVAREQQLQSYELANSIIVAASISHSKATKILLCIEFVFLTEPSSEVPGTKCWQNRYQQLTVGAKFSLHLYEVEHALP